jgi:peptidoglycan hydrolase-like protein with peptidoglycan-binding domain
MPLVSKLFTVPRDPKLDACLVSDAAHITPSSRGEHVRKIQIALNRLNEGPGQQTFLVMDGIYGPKTAAAVQAYKDERDITQPWQDTADDIVGKRTIKSLDDEMDILENEVDKASQYICLYQVGEPHDHSRCPPWRGGSEYQPDGTISHAATPINPTRRGRMLQIGGQGESMYQGFEDCVPDPACDSSMPKGDVNGRLLTSRVPSGTVSDIAFRSAPLDKWMQTEIKRICMLGARLTFAGDSYNADLGQMSDTIEFIKTIATIIEYGTADDEFLGSKKQRQYVVAVVHTVDHKLPICGRR